jgi:predicted RNase H-like nuclease
MNSSSYCVGVDGAKRGWIGVWRHPAGLEFNVYSSAGELAAVHRRAQVIAVDIPIGLSDLGPRAPDVLARTFVGGKRASSIFSAPVRGILDAESQPEASRRHREIDGRGFGAQAFAILSKIREWDSLLQADPLARRQVHEIHPEVSFAVLNGNHGLADGKKSAAGAEARQRLLSAAFQAAEIEALLAAVPRRLAARDDVLDALAALWSAERIQRGASGSLPSPVTFDSCAIPTAIHY